MRQEEQIDIIGKGLKNRQDFYLRIKNKTQISQPVILFDVVGAYNDQNGITTALTGYSWDMTAELVSASFFGLDTLVVLAAGISGIYNMYTYVNPSGTFTTAEQVLTGLNSFSIGTFYREGNIIKIDNPTYTFSSINLVQLVVAAAITNVTFGLGGSLIYNSGFSTGLIGSLGRISTGNPFWINQVAMTDGPLNRSALDGSSSASQAGLFANINSATAKTVYVGFSSSVDMKLYVNNELIVSVVTGAEKAALAANVNSILGTAFTGSGILGECWHIIPINLVAGNNLLQVTPSKSIFGLEVYDNTASEIDAATGYGDLTLLYSSVDYIGQNLF